MYKLLDNRIFQVSIVMIPELLFFGIVQIKAVEVFYPQQAISLPKVTVGTEGWQPIDAVEIAGLENKILSVEQAEESFGCHEHLSVRQLDDLPYLIVGQSVCHTVMLVTGVERDVAGTGSRSQKTCQDDERGKDSVHCYWLFVRKYINF